MLCVLPLLNLHVWWSWSARVTCRQILHSWWQGCMQSLTASFSSRTACGGQLHHSITWSPWLWFRREYNTMSSSRDSQQEWLSWWRYFSRIASNVMTPHPVACNSLEVSSPSHCGGVNKAWSGVQTAVRAPRKGFGRGRYVFIQSFLKWIVQGWEMQNI